MLYQPVRSNKCTVAPYPSTQALSSPIKRFTPVFGGDDVDDEDPLEVAAPASAMRPSGFHFVRSGVNFDSEKNHGHTNLVIRKFSTSLSNSYLTSASYNRQT